MKSQPIATLLQKASTEERKNNLIRSGYIFLTLDQYKAKLLTYGLKLQIKGSYKYYNNLNKNLGAWLECAADAVDSKNIGFANTTGIFYQNERLKETEIYMNFRQFRNLYFTQTKTGHLINI